MRRSLHSGKPRHGEEAEECGGGRDHKHRWISRVCGEPHARRKPDDGGYIHDEAVEPEPFAAPLRRNDRGHQRSSDDDDDREAGAAHERDREDRGHGVRETQPERGRAEEYEAGGEGEPIAEAGDDARRRELERDGREHQRAGCEPGADTGCADGGGVLRHYGQKQVEADHRAEAG